jgi:hypothetical protein
MAQKKMSLKSWINSQLKNKGLTVSQAKKNAGKYKSIAAAKKAGSLYYTNKDGKIMIAAYAEDLKMPLKRPKSLEINDKIIKTELPPHPSGKGVPKYKSEPKGLTGGDPSKSDLIITQINRIKNKAGKTLESGQKAKLDSIIKKIKEGGNISGMTKILDRLESSIEKRKGMNMGGMMAAVGSSAANRKRNTATGLSGMKGGGMMKKKGYAKGGMKKKGYAMGGAMKRPTANQKGLKKLPTAVRNKMGYMAKGGMSKKKKGYAKGGASRRGK